MGFYLIEMERDIKSKRSKTKEKKCRAAWVGLFE